MAALLCGAVALIKDNNGFSRCQSEGMPQGLSDNVRDQACHGNYRHFQLDRKQQKHLDLFREIDRIPYNLYRICRDGHPVAERHSH
jgi:hypothetical protein